MQIVETMPSIISAFVVEGPIHLLFGHQTVMLICVDQHAEQGCTIQINITPNTLGTVKTDVSGGGRIITRTTPINHEADE